MAQGGFSWAARANGALFHTDTFISSHVQMLSAAHRTMWVNIINLHFVLKSQVVPHSGDEHLFSHNSLMEDIR